MILAILKPEIGKSKWTLTCCRRVLYETDNDCEYFSDYSQGKYQPSCGFIPWTLYNYEDEVYHGTEMSDDIDVVSYLINMNVSPMEYISDGIKMNRDLVMKCTKIKASSFIHCYHHHDKELIIEATKGGLNVLPYIDPSYLDEEPFLVNLVNANPDMYDLIPFKYRLNPKLVEKVVEIDGSRYISLGLNDERLLFLAMKTHEKLVAKNIQYCNDPRYALIVAKYHPMFFENLSYRFRSNLQLAKLAIAKRPRTIIATLGEVYYSYELFVLALNSQKQTCGDEMRWSFRISPRELIMKYRNIEDDKFDISHEMAIHWGFKNLASGLKPIYHICDIDINYLTHYHL